MSRLIDADKFMEWIDAGHLRHPSELVYSEIDVVNLIAHQPTAYSVEAVVRELEEKSTFYAHEAEGDKDMGYEYLTTRKYGISDGLDIAIEIVKRWTE